MISTERQLNSMDKGAVTQLHSASVHSCSTNENYYFQLKAFTVSVNSEWAVEKNWNRRAKSRR